MTCSIGDILGSRNVLNTLQSFEQFDQNDDGKVCRPPPGAGMSGHRMVRETNATQRKCKNTTKNVVIVHSADSFFTGNPTTRKVGEKKDSELPISCRLAPTIYTVYTEEDFID